VFMVKILSHLRGKKTCVDVLIEMFCNFMWGRVVHMYSPFLRQEDVRTGIRIGALSSIFSDLVTKNCKWYLEII